MKLSTIAGAVAAIGIGASLAPAPAAAQSDWPNRPVRVIVPFAAGGAADTLARSVTEGLSEAFGQQFVVENVTGAGGVIGVTALANSEPDNYTFGVINASTQVIGPAINPAVSYDPNEAFAYIAMLGGAPSVLAVHAGLGINTLDELVEAARNARPLMAYGSPGAATMVNMVPAKFFQDIEVEVEHIPYRGASEALMDAVAGHVAFVSATVSTARPQLAAGTLVAVAISSPERMPDLPDVPTFADLGHPELSLLTWFGFAGPAGVDEDVVNRLNAEIRRILNSEAVSARLEGEGYVLLDFSPEEFFQYQLDQVATWGPVARSLAD